MLPNRLRPVASLSNQNSTGILFVQTRWFNFWRSNQLIFCDQSLIVNNKACNVYHANQPSRGHVQSYSWGYLGAKPLDSFSTDSFIKCRLSIPQYSEMTFKRTKIHFRLQRWALATLRWAGSELRPSLGCGLSRAESGLSCTKEVHFWDPAPRECYFEIPGPIYRLWSCIWPGVKFPTLQSLKLNLRLRRN